MTAGSSADPRGAMTAAAGNTADDVRVVDVVAGRNLEPLGIGSARPPLSWRVETDRPGWFQTAHEIEVTSPDGSAPQRTGVVESDACRFVPWPAEPLGSRDRARVRVRVVGSDGSRSPWSEPVMIEAGLLRPSDWTAEWIAAPWDTGEVPVFSSVVAPGAVESARLYISACGVYEASINDTVCSEEILAPGWTSYPNRIRYATLDVTDLLREGDNDLRVRVGNGWFTGRLGDDGRHSFYGEDVALLAQLETTDASGVTTTFVTGTHWDVAPSGIVTADLYDGETFDAGRVPGPQDWVSAVEVDPDVGPLEAPLGPPVRRIETLPVVEVMTTPSGGTVLDFGQNLVGRVRFTMDARADTDIVLRHAEVMENGELATAPLRTAKATDRCITREPATITWEPRFTIHGFRYVEVTGWPGEIDPGAFEAVVCHSDMVRTGEFSCSDDRLNRLHENAVWGMRGNFVDLPTDCPQRDERLGWTGDIAVFAPTASYLYDVDGFLASWLADLAVEQAGDGSVPLVIPSIFDHNPAAAGWGDAAVVVPWVLYQRFGDREILEAQFPSMRAWVDHVAGLTGEDRLWSTGFQYGDWLDPAAPNDDPAAGRTDPYLVATACFARCAEIVGHAAEVLHDGDAASQYSQLCAEIKAGFRHEFVTPAGRLVSDSQTAHALALHFDLLEDPALEAVVADRLAVLVRRNGYRIGTGFIGTPLLCDALSDTGHLDAAYRLLLGEKAPSWLYAVAMGATTIWERWDALKEDGTVNGDWMTSFNHYAFGAVADWMHRVIAGLAPSSPGYRTISIRPRPGGGLRSATATLRSPFGVISTSWSLDGSTFTLDARVPPSTTATVVLPDGSHHDVASGTHHWCVELDAAVMSQIRPAPSSDSTVAELRSDETLWATVVDLLPDIELVPPGSGLEDQTIRELHEVFGDGDSGVLDDLDIRLAQRRA